MNFDEYQDCAQRTSRFRDVVFGELYGSCHAAQRANDRLGMAAMGVAGEAGEFADLAKKVLYHGHTLDRDRAIKEVGDVLWYVAEAASALGVSLSEVARRNVEKLGQRYPDGFSTEASVHRKPGDT